MRIAPLFSTLAALVVLGASAVASAAFSGVTNAQVTFEAIGPAGFKMKGETSELTLAEDAGNVVITVPLTNLKTGIDLRDHHMKEKYLEVPKYPTATLTVARSALKVPSGDRVEADAPGMFTLHGQTRPVRVHYDMKSEGGGVTVHGKVHVNMNDYGIVVPSYLGITVKPDVDVAASFHASGS